MRFISAKATKSRLMGSLGLFIKWEINFEILSQYIILDFEGGGVSDYVSIINPSEMDHKKEIERLFGGFGSEIIDLDTNYAMSLLNYSYEETEDIEIELKNFMENTKDLKFNKVSKSELNKLLSKEIENDYEFINYILMRIISKDKEGIFYLTNKEEISETELTKINGTLLKNVINKKENSIYECEFIYEDMDGYFLSKGILEINNLELMSIKFDETYSIYDFEAFDEIKKEEYLSIYKLKNREVFEELFFKDNLHMQKCEMCEGNLYTNFKKDNDHVKENEYIINNDIKNIFYVQNNYVFVGNYDQINIKLTEQELLKKYGDYLDILEHLYFDENILFDYCESCSTDFDDFLD
ncbi:MAG: hypothetical protein R3Y64_04235 [Peptostreptococcaceae bacterium]